MKLVCCQSSLLATAAAAAAAVVAVAVAAAAALTTGQGQTSRPLGTSTSQLSRVSHSFALPACEDMTCLWDFGFCVLGKLAHDTISFSWLGGFSIPAFCAEEASFPHSVFHGLLCQVNKALVPIRTRL